MLKVGLVIGRFQGYHNGHDIVIKRALADNDFVIIGVGSTNTRRSFKNPFNFEERKELIETCLLGSGLINIIPIVDKIVDQDWVNQVRNLVNEIAPEDSADITLYGCDKDSTTYYLKLFPFWHIVLVDKTVDIDSTRIRNSWYTFDQSDLIYSLTKLMPEASINWMNSRKFDECIQGEWAYYTREKKQFQDYPFPESLTFCCGDAVIKCHDKVLMITRKFHPGKGCLALPGGFKNNNETFLETAVREGYEETGIKISKKALMDCLIGTRLFDSPNRSLGIPRATQAAYFDISKLFQSGAYPAVTPLDDAMSVKWVSIFDICDDEIDNIYDDHAQIIKRINSYN